MTKSRNKIIATILLVLLIMMNILPVGVSLAVSIGESVELISIGTVPYHLRSSSISGHYVVTELVGYYDNDSFYPAYCLNNDKAGVEDEDGYDVTLTEILSDQETYNKVWRVVVAGYPYNSAESLGVSDWKYAYQATKMAVYCVLGQSDVNDFYADDDIGQQIVDLIQRLVDEGENGTATYETPIANIDKSGDIVLEGDYYIQNYTVSSNVTISDYNVTITNFPEGTIITNTSGVSQKSFAEGETFQIRIPKDIVEEQDISGEIAVEVNTKSYAVFYATSYDETLQDYAVTGVPISSTTSTEKLTLKAPTSSIKIHKVDSENNEINLEGVEFNILDEDGNVLETITTDENGEAMTKEYLLKDYKNLVIQEVNTQESYVLNEEPVTVELEANQVVEVTFENEKIKGYVEITKVSADDNMLTGEEKGTALANVEFEIYNSNDELVETLITDENGKAKSSLLEYGEYYVKEINTGSDAYLLNTDIYEFEIKENMQTIPITIENTSVNINLDIDKSGVEQAQANDEIKYSFDSLKNSSNVTLDNFTWTDNLPYEYIRITKLFTGTYNEDLDYVVKYKTNKSEDYIEYGTYNTQTNNYIDFTSIDLEDDEYITDFKLEFGTVMAGFEAVEKPFIFAKVLSTVTADDEWTNYTSLAGNYKEYEVEDTAEWTTISYGKELTITKLPRTGF